MLRETLEASNIGKVSANAVAQCCCVQPDKGKFQVKYAKKCRPACSHSINDKELLDMQDDLLKVWSKWFPIKPAVLAQDPLFVVEVSLNAA